MENERYIRVGTTQYKQVEVPQQNGSLKEVRIPWNYETLRQDHSKEFIAGIERYDGFCSIPSHTNYERIINRFFNEYEPIPHIPKEGDYSKTLYFLKHIFEEQYELGLDYLQLLYLQPLIRLPILLFVSKKRNTGKTTFLNLLKAIFGGNATFNTNEDFRSNFNSDWANKLIVAVDEVLLDRREDSERIKNLSTAKTFKAEAKGKDRREVDFFAKFVLCANNEDCPIIIEQGETRYWVRKINPIEKENTNLLSEMIAEIPHFLYFLIHRKLYSKNESRMWFNSKLLFTAALKQIIDYNRGRVEIEMLLIINDIMQLKELEVLYFCVNEIGIKSSVFAIFRPYCLSSFFTKRNKINKLSALDSVHFNKVFFQTGCIIILIDLQPQIVYIFSISRNLIVKAFAVKCFF